jgi:hypothetical protein
VDFVIVAGERRYRAAKQAKLKEVPAQVRNGDGNALTLRGAENVIRADLNPIDEARAYERLVSEHGRGEGGEARRAQREAERRAPRPPPPARGGAGPTGGSQVAARLRRPHRSGSPSGNRCSPT